MIVIRWENDETDSAPTWQELLDHVRATQWWEYESEAEFREDMAQRAPIWSGTRVETTGTAEQFFRELQRARVVRIEQDGVNRDGSLKVSPARARRLARAGRPGGCSDRPRDL